MTFSFMFLEVDRDNGTQRRRSTHRCISKVTNRNDYKWEIRKIQKSTVPAARCGGDSKFMRD